MGPDPSEAAIARMKLNRALIGYIASEAYEGARSPSLDSDVKRLVTDVGTILNRYIDRGP